MPFLAFLLPFCLNMGICVSPRAKKDGVLPFATPVKTTDGQFITELFIPKGTSILISMRHCNTNPEIWGPDAAEWKPERWLQPLPETVAKARVPGVYANM